MKKAVRGLTFKVGTAIVVAELLVLSLVGLVYVTSFSVEVDRRIETQVQLPGRLMNDGVLALDSIADESIMLELVGEELLRGMVVGLDHNVYYSLDSSDLGQNIADIEDVNGEMFSLGNASQIMRYTNDALECVSVLYALDKVTPRFFVYIVVGTSQSNLSKIQYTQMFVIGSIATFLVTSLIISYSFKSIILNRLVEIVTVVSKLQNGDVTARIENPQSSDELGFLQRQVNVMISELQKYQENMEVIVEERTVQLQALNEEITAFSYSVSHDLRSPLRSIDGFSKQLLEKYSDKIDAVGQDYLKRVRASAVRMGYLIDDILMLSQLSLTNLTTSKVDLSSIVRKIITQYKLDEPSRNVECIIGNNLIVEVDERLLTQVLENLLSNAWKFTSKNDSAIIEFGETERDGKRFFYLKDNGVGFDMKYKDQLFKPFHRLHKKEDFEGTGIGLAIVKRIISKHGGIVWVEGELLKGATFFFSLSEIGGPDQT